MHQKLDSWQHRRFKMDSLPIFFPGSSALVSTIRSCFLPEPDVIVLIRIFLLESLKKRYCPLVLQLSFSIPRRPFEMFT